MHASPVAPPILAGDPHARGLALARLGAAHAAAVRERAAAGCAAVAALGAEAWVRRQWQAQQALLPEMTAFVEGMAAGFCLSAAAVFAGHVRYAVEDRGAAAPDVQAGPDPEGCSAFAVIRADGRALLAKNRDNPPYFRPLQSLLRQRDPAWGGREILSVGSHGSIPSASSGMNSDGFCIADTSVRTGDLGIGALRYYLMEALLIRCASVAEGIAMIRAMPHLGGGNLVLADAGGDVAAVELGHSVVHVGRAGAAGWVARTNHHTDPALAPRLMEAPGSPLRENSESRLGGLTLRLGAGVAGWDVADCAALLGEHGAAGGHAAICRHDETVATLSGAIFDPAARLLHLSRGNPCGDEWQLASLA